MVATFGGAGGGWVGRKREPHVGRRDIQRGVNLLLQIFPFFHQVHIAADHVIVTIMFGTYPKQIFFCGIPQPSLGLK